MRSYILLVSLLFTVLLHHRVKAQTLDPISTDRPDQTEAPSITPVNYLQAEAGFNYERIDAGNEVFVYPTLLTKFGITNRFELRLITEQATFRNAADQQQYGVLPVQVGFKSNLVSQKGVVPEISFIGHLVLPAMGSREFRTDFYATNFRFVLRHDLNDRLSVSYNAGAEWDGFSPAPTFIYTFATAYQFTDRLGMYVEAFGFAPQERVANHQADAGFTWLINNDVQLDISAGTALTENAPDYYAALGFSFRLPVKR